MSLKDRRIRMIRCHIDPNIPPKPRLAFTFTGEVGSFPGEAFLTDFGVLLKATFKHLGRPDEARDFLIPFTNIENIEFYPEEIKLTRGRKLQDVETLTL